MSNIVEKCLEYAKQIEDFPLGKCGPSDDSDMQYAYASEFRDLSLRFFSYLRRIDDPVMEHMIKDIDEDIDTSFVSEAHRLRAQIMPIIDYLRDCSKNPEYSERVVVNRNFVESEIVDTIRNIQHARFDLGKLIRFVEELNSAYESGNYLSTILLLRAIMNHVPPIFGADTFAQMVACSGRSVKKILQRLDENARPIADLHAHMTIRKTEHLPTRNQIEPYKSSLEILLNEAISKIEENEDKEADNE